MPKRTNQFQKVVTYIAQQLAPIGARVVESEELAERGFQELVLREVDTVIEANVGLTCVRIAVESRERSRTDSIQWIDELIGKYSGLPIDRVIAVSNSGFSAAAQQKSALHRIELLTPEEVRGIDWPAQFQKVGIAIVDGGLKLESVAFETRPRIETVVSLDHRIERDSDGESISVREFIQLIGPRAIELASDYHHRQRKTLYKTRADLEMKAIVSFRLTITDLHLVAGEARYRIDAIEPSVGIVQKAADLSVQHARLAGALVSSATFDGLRTVIAQTANASQGKVFVERTRG